MQRKVKEIRFFVKIDNFLESVIINLAVDEFAENSDSMFEMER
jgi:hypothetical protein